MGWLYTHGAGRRDIINELIQSEENESRRWETMAHCVRGNVLWSVIKLTKKAEGTAETFIGCYLLDKGDGRGWGYKELCESMGPCYYTCPLKYLDMAPVASQEWRDAVVAYHQRMNRRFEIGQKVELENATIPWVKLVSLRPLLGIYNGLSYRIPRRMIGEVI